MFTARFLSDNFKYCLLTGLTFSILLLNGCTKDSAAPFESTIDCETVNPVFDNQIFAIIDRTCNEVGCHTTLSPYGDYTSFAGIEPLLNNGRFEERVFTIGDMPPHNAPDTMLITETDLEMLRCWMENGFPEN